MRFKLVPPTCHPPLLPPPPSVPASPPMTHRGSSGACSSRPKALGALGQRRATMAHHATRPCNPADALHPLPLLEPRRGVPVAGQGASRCQRLPKLPGCRQVSRVRAGAPPTSALLTSLAICPRRTGCKASPALLRTGFFGAGDPGVRLPPCPLPFLAVWSTTARRLSPPVTHTSLLCSSRREAALHSDCRRCTSAA